MRQKNKLEKTIVIFRRWPKKEGGGVIAIFPCDVATNDPYTCSSYAHNGQHATCEPVGLIHRTKPARLHEQDVKDLKYELEHYVPPDAHYRLEVRERYLHCHLGVRKAKLKQWSHTVLAVSGLKIGIKSEK